MKLSSLPLRKTLKGPVRAWGLTVFVLGMVFVWMPACAPISGLDSGTTRVFQIPFPDENGDYRLQKVEIRSFHQPHTLGGSYAKILVDPYESNGTIESSKPVGRFARTREGVMVPADYVSLLATSIHAHMERLREINLAVGLSDQQVDWPAVIGVEANVVNKQKKNTVRNNALFERRLNALLLVPYSDSELPIGVNAGILAHEHFHRIFHALVLSRLKPVEKTAEPSSPQIYNETLLRAMNEGFADFWGWVYTGDDEFIAHSLPQERCKRTLKAKATPLISTDDLRQVLKGDQFKNEENRVGLAYEIGSRYARILRAQTSKKLGAKMTLEQRIEAARTLIEILPRLAERAEEAQAKNEFLSPTAVVNFQATAESANPIGQGDSCAR